ncbi:MAG: hypothetical protein HY918_04640 [Candidatus Doudnabacteria bacterium]|nr:hypothetical protein [Candidatus Doudnabacteria bacterium]
MSWIQNIQNKTQAEKLRIIWAVAIVVGILLIAVWVISYRMHKNAPADTTLFQTIGRGFKDVKDNFKK